MICWHTKPWTASPTRLLPPWQRKKTIPGMEEREKLKLAASQASTHRRLLACCTCWLQNRCTTAACHPARLLLRSLAADEVHRRGDGQAQQAQHAKVVEAALQAKQGHSAAQTLRAPAQRASLQPWNDPMFPPTAALPSLAARPSYCLAAGQQPAPSYWLRIMATAEAMVMPSRPSRPKYWKPPCTPVAAVASTAGSWRRGRRRVQPHVQGMQCASAC